MPTTVTKTIGTGGDYTTLQAWEDASPANLVTSDQIWRGECFNQEFFSSSASLLSVSGSTTDATRYKELTTYAGASFVDNASVQTNALRYNASNGAGIRSSYAWGGPVSVNESYFRISKMQISATTAVALNGVGTTGMVVDKCILENSGVSNEAIRAYGVCTIKNTLIVGRSTGSLAKLDNGVSVYNCTFARTGSSTSNIFTGSYSTTTLKNCAFFGGATTLASGSSTRTYTTCYTDTASPPSGCTTVAYDTSTGSGFQNKTDSTRDFRIKTGSALIGVGTTDATNAATDIVGTSRPQGTGYDVGAWELVVAGGATYTLTAASGSFALTGQATALKFNRVLSAASGSFALTGQAAGLAFNRKLSAASGSFSLTGQAAGLTFNRVLSAASGSFALAGQDATLTYTPSGATYTLVAASGSFALAGQDAGLRFNRVLSAESGSFTLTGSDVGPYTSVTGIRRYRAPRKILVTVKGARFLVPEDQLDQWLDDKEDEIVKQAVKPVAIVSKKARVVKPNALPAPKAATSDLESAAAVMEFNKRVADRIAMERRRLQDMEDEELILLLL